MLIYKHWMFYVYCVYRKKIKLQLRSIGHLRIIRAPACRINIRTIKIKIKMHATQKLLRRHSNIGTSIRMERKGERTKTRSYVTYYFYELV